MRSRRCLRTNGSECANVMSLNGRPVSSQPVLRARSNGYLRTLPPQSSSNKSSKRRRRTAALHTALQGDHGSRAAKIKDAERTLRNRLKQFVWDIASAQRATNVALKSFGANCIELIGTRPTSRAELRAIVHPKLQELQFRYSEATRIIEQVICILNARGPAKTAARR